MRKESLVTAKGGELTAPLTRARAAAFRASGQLPPLKALTQQNQKRTLRGNPKSAALDENNNGPNNACLQRKRRAVLQDVTNVCCEGSYRNCLNAAKIQVNIPSILFMIFGVILSIFQRNNDKLMLSFYIGDFGSLNVSQI